MSTGYYAGVSSGEPNRLSERQRECLRLVHANFEAKEIAKALGLSPHTVNEHLRDARRILGASRSMEAARILLAYERDNPPVPDPIGVGAALPTPEEELAPQSELPSAVVRRNRYQLGLLVRISLIVAIALGAVALTGALLVGAEAITHIFRAERVDISDPPYRR